MPAIDTLRRRSRALLATASSRPPYAVCLGLSFSKPSRTRLSAVATIASSLERGVQPRTRFAFALVAFLLAEFGEDLLHRRVAERGQPHQPVGQLARGHAAGRAAHARLEHLGDSLHRHEVAGDRQKALALGRRDSSWRAGAGRRHRARRRRRNRASDSRARAVHQSLHDQDRRRIVGPQHRAEHADRIDHGQLQAAALLGDEVPRGALGQRLGLHVGRTSSPFGSVQLVSSNGVCCGGWP